MFESLRNIFGSAPPPEQTPEPLPLYFPSWGAADEEIRAGLEAGHIERWRVGRGGVQWFKRHPQIRGVESRQRIEGVR